MEFPLKTVYLLVGILLVLGSMYSAFVARHESKDSQKVNAEGRFFINLVAFVFGVILLRLAWVMYYGLSRSVVF